MDEKTTRSHDQKDTVRLRIYPAIISAALCVLWIAGCRQDTTQSPRVDLLGGKRTLSKDERMEWWREARFGMFIHWGLYAVPAGDVEGQASPRHRRVDHEQRAKIPVAEYETVRRAVQSRQVQRG